MKSLITNNTCNTQYKIYVLFIEQGVADYGPLKFLPWNKTAVVLTTAPFFKLTKLAEAHLKQMSSSFQYEPEARPLSTLLTFQIKVCFYSDVH